MVDIPRVPERSWHTDLTGEVQTVTDRNERRPAHEKRKKRRKQDARDPEEPETDPLRSGSPGEEPDETEAPTGKPQQRGEDEPGQVIDLEA